MDHRFLPRAAMRYAFQVMLTLALALLVVMPAYADDEPKRPATTGDANASTPDADKLFGAIVKVDTRSVPNARSADTLGTERLSILTIAPKSLSASTAGALASPVAAGRFASSSA